MPNGDVPWVPDAQVHDDGPPAHRSIFEPPDWEEERRLWLEQERELARQRSEFERRRNTDG